MFIFCWIQGKENEKITPQPLQGGTGSQHPPQNNRNGIQNYRIVVSLMIQTSQEINTSICFTVIIFTKSNASLVEECQIITQQHHTFVVRYQWVALVGLKSLFNLPKAVYIYTLERLNTLHLKPLCPRWKNPSPIKLEGSTQLSLFAIVT